MGSVHFDNGERCSSTAGITAGSSWTLRAWFRMNSYASNFTWGMGIANGIGSPSVIAVDCNETAAGDLNLFLYTGSFQAVVLQTGSFTGWVGVGLTHVGGTTAYDVYMRLEGSSSMTHIGTLDLGSEINANATIAGDGGFGDPANCDIRAFCVRSGVAETSSALFTALDTFATYNGSGDHTFLPLTSAATAGTNNGTAGAYTVTGTPVNEASEPTVGGGGATLDRSDDNTISTSDQLLVEKTFPQDSISTSDQLLVEKTFPQDSISASDSLGRDAYYSRQAPGGSSTVFFID